MRFILPILATSALLSGCGSIAGSATQSMADALTVAVKNQNDIATVEAGVPAYLLLIGGMAQNNPDDARSQIAAAQLHSMYGGLVTSNPARAQRIAKNALDYGLQGLALSPRVKQSATEVRALPARDFPTLLEKLNEKDTAALYTAATAWLGFIQANSSDWNAIGDLAKARLMLERVLDLNPTYEDGMPHLYLGVLETIVPPATGGRPDKAKQHFEMAQQLSAGKNLMIDVLFAKHYARTVFDRELHDTLLQHVLAASPDVKDYVLMNTLAQQEAQQLLVDSARYFE